MVIVRETWGAGSASAWSGGCSFCFWICVHTRKRSVTVRLHILTCILNLTEWRWRSDGGDRVASHCCRAALMPQSDYILFVAAAVTKTALATHQKEPSQPPVVRGNTYWWGTPVHSLLLYLGFHHSPYLPLLRCLLHRWGSISFVGLFNLFLFYLVCSDHDKTKPCGNMTSIVKTNLTAKQSKRGLV